MTRTILITRPKMVDDIATAHTYYWAEPIIEEAKILGYPLIDYNNNNVTYDKISDALEKMIPTVYIHFGHGCVSSLIGQFECILTNGTKNCDLNNENYLKSYMYRLSNDIECDSLCNHKSNVDLLSNKITIAYACHSAKRLGVCAMKSGAKAYIGFDDYLIFMTDSKRTEKIFTEPLLAFTYSLLNGDTLKMAKQKTLDKYDYYITMYKKVKYLALLLLWDRESFKVYGDENLTIFS